jgi:hypothetical protein
MTILCTIDLETREVSLPAGQVIASYDHNVDVIRFQAETIPGFSLDTSSIRIAAQGPNKSRHDYAVDPSTVQIEEETGYITFDWPIPAGVTEMPLDVFKYGDKGNLIFAVCAEIIDGSTVSKAWHSDDGIITVVAHLEPESGGGEDPEEEATNRQMIGQLQTDVAVVQREISGIASGTPPTASSTSEMDPDESTVYINTTDGNWYYYDGSVWHIGGVYGGAVTSTTFDKPGVPADDFATGQALADKADADDLDALDDRVTAVEGDVAEKADEADVTALDTRVAALESGVTPEVPYEERGDLYTLLVSAEVVEMQKTDYRLTYNATTGAVAEQYYTAGHPVTHYIDPSKLGYERLWVHTIVANVWSVLADYDPDENTYTFLSMLPNQNTGKLIDFGTIPEGHYLALTSNTANWKTGLLVYLGRVWIKPGYTPKHEGWDVPVSTEPIPCELYPVSMGYPAFYIDMEKYQDQLIRLVNSGTMATTSYGFKAYTDLAGTSNVDISSLFSLGNFSAWIYPGRYLVFFYRGVMTANTLNLTMGYVPPENARKAKEEGRWGAKFAFHNVDTPNELIFACAVGSILDIDVCRTLDGYFVCIHGTTINGHTIASTNLEDMELAYNQMEVTRALKVMRKYGTTCYFNFRETTSAQIAALLERSYNYLGKMLAYDGDITASDSELAGHAGKYYAWASSATIAQMIEGGISPGKIYAPLSKLEDTPYNVGDIICVKSIASGETLSNFSWDGECAVLWVNSDTPGFVRG